MKINKYLLVFSFLFTFLISGYLFILFRFFPVLFHHALYYCREMVKNISFGLPPLVGNFIFIFLSLLILHTAVKLLISFFKIYRFSRTLSPLITGNKRTRKLIKELGLENKVMTLPKNAPTAFCFGFLKPRIFITTGIIRLVSLKELAVILRHEKYHLENKDTATLLLADLAQSLFPFFPLVSDLIGNYRLDRELEADRQAIRQKNDQYCLSDVLKKLITYKPAPLPAVARLNAYETLEVRIKALLNLKVPAKKLSLKNLLQTFFTLIIFLVFALSSTTATETASENKLHKSFCRPNTDCHHSCSGLLYTPALTY